MNTRRQFLIRAPLGVAGFLAACQGSGAPAASGGAGAASAAGDTTPGATPAFNTGNAVGPEVAPATFAEAEKLARVTMAEDERQMAAASWRTSMAGLYERRTGPRKLGLEDSLAPGTTWDPVLPGMKVGPAHDRFVRSTADPGPLPSSDEDIAFAPVWRLSRWIERRQLTSERLTRIYLERMQRLDPKLHCIITRTDDHALAQAKQADAEIGAGRYRGPLHGIPWGAKDLLDTKGIRTTYGAAPFKDRVPGADAAVVTRLDAAGAVLVAKLSMGALALNDIWFGGQTMNPWVLEEGAGGSSAGPGSATAAGLVAFAIGSETQGSIIDPCMRCGDTGLRPTFGRVPRTGAMTLCWTQDKLGPIARGVEDTILVLHAIAGPDAGDVYSRPARLDFDAGEGVRGLRVGYFPAWMKEPPATQVDRDALDLLRKAGLQPVEVSLPDWPYDGLNVLLFAEAAAAFEELTLSGRDRELTAQVPDAWPNLFRESRFLSAVDFVQADRMRRKIAAEMDHLMGQVDLLLVPSLRDEMLVISNFTGHPSLTLRTGFVEVSKARSDWAPDPKHPLPTFSPPRRVPYGVTLVGRLFDEGTIARVGLALERLAGVSAARPKIG